MNNGAFKNNKTMLEIMNELPTPTFITTLDGCVVEINHATTIFLGFSYTELLTTNIYDLIHPEDVKHLKCKTGFNYNDYIQISDFEIRIITSTGDYTWASVSSSLLEGFKSNEHCVIYQISSLQKQKKLEAELTCKISNLTTINIELEKMANIDHLTNIANRRKFMLWLGEALSYSSKSGTSFSLAIIDIDFFKSYNDSLGHIEGDFALRTIAEKLSTSIRHSDRVSRYGGEEFAIIIDNAGKDITFSILERIRMEIERMNIGKRNLTISCGFAVYTPVNGKIANPNDLLILADTMLYKSKHSGRNMVSGAYFYENE